ncbi:MAG: ABC-2 family transporter protein [bacterium]|nr:ABC-2 family transporter protein [bacterium]
MRVIWALVVTAFRAQVRRRFDFAMGVVSDLLIQLASLTFVLILYRQYPNIGGWGQNELLFIFGFSQITTGLCTIFLVPLMMVGDYYMYQGHLDRVLLRPYPSIVGVLFEEAIFFDIGNLLLGCILLSFVGAALGVWTFTNIVLAMVLIIASFVLVASLLVLGVALALVFHDRFQVLHLLVNSLQQFSFYPVTVFPPLIRAVVTYVIPVALSSYYPAVVLLGRDSSAAWATIALAPALLGLSLLMWNIGISRYESTGN